MGTKNKPGKYDCYANFRAGGEHCLYCGADDYEDHSFIEFRDDEHGNEVRVEHKREDCPWVKAQAALSGTAGKRAAEVIALAARGGANHRRLLGLQVYARRGEGGDVKVPLIRVGDEVKILIFGTLECLYGRVRKIDDGRVYVRSPGGASFSAGLAVVIPLVDEEDFMKLAELDRQAGYVDPWMAL